MASSRKTCRRSSNSNFKHSRVRSSFFFFLSSSSSSAHAFWLVPRRVWNEKERNDEKRDTHNRQKKPIKNGGKKKKAKKKKSVEIIKTREGLGPTWKHILFIFMTCLERTVYVKRGGLRGRHNIPHKHNNKNGGDLIKPTKKDRRPSFFLWILTEFLENWMVTWFFFNAKDVLCANVDFRMKISTSRRIDGGLMAASGLEINRVGTVALLPLAPKYKKKEKKKGGQWVVRMTGRVAKNLC